MILLEVICHAREHDTPAARRAGCVCLPESTDPRTEPGSGARRHHRLTSRQRRSAVAEYVEGDTVRELAARYDCSPGQIVAIVRASGVPLRPRGARRVLDDREAKQIAREYAAGASLGELAGRYGCAPGTIRRAVVEAGGALRPGRCQSAGREFGTRIDLGGAQC